MAEIQNYRHGGYIHHSFLWKIIRKIAKRRPLRKHVWYQYVYPVIAPELASVADELYLKASTEEQSTIKSLKHIAYEIKRNFLRTLLKNMLNLGSEAHEEELKGFTGTIKRGGKNELNSIK